MDLFSCSIGDWTLNIIRLVAVHRRLVDGKRLFQVFDLKAFEQREDGMGLVEIVIDCGFVSMSALNVRGLQHATYQC